MKIEMPRISEKLPDGGDLLTALERGDAENLLFKNQMISGEILEDVEIKGCIFQNCRILGGRLTRISAWDSSFRSCDFSNCVMEDGYFQRVEFLGCKLTGTSSVSSVLKEVYLEDCSCRMWNLSNATIKPWDSIAAIVRRRCSVCGIERTSASMKAVSVAVISSKPH